MLLLMMMLMLLLMLLLMLVKQRRLWNILSWSKATLRGPSALPQTKILQKNHLNVQKTKLG